MLARKNPIMHDHKIVYTHTRQIETATGQQKKERERQHSRCVCDYLYSHCSSVSNSFNQVIYGLFHLICAANNTIKPKPPCIMAGLVLYLLPLGFLVFWTYIDWLQQLRICGFCLCTSKDQFFKNNFHEDFIIGFPHWLPHLYTSNISFFFFI